jgi:hypothetical protein
MSFQLVGQVVGSAFGPIGALVGGMIGGVLDRATGDGPDAGDLSAPGLQLGRPLPRVYGRVRLPVNPIWASSYRATEHGGKGAPSGAPSLSFSLDILGAICDGTNVIAVTRIWVNKKLVYTALADSTDESIVNSQDTDYWSSFELLTGGPSQVPWSTYEDAVTAANAPAYRNLCTIGFADLQCGGSKTPPAIEVEVITAGTQGVVDPLVLLHVSATTDLDDESYYEAPGTSGGSGTVTQSGGVIAIASTSGAGEAYRVWVLPRAKEAGEPLTLQSRFVADQVTWTGNYQNYLFSYEAEGGAYFRCSIKEGGTGAGDDVYEVWYEFSIGALGATGNVACDAEGHVALEFDGVGSVWFYVDGVPIVSAAYDDALISGATANVRIGHYGITNINGNVAYTVDSLRAELRSLWGGSGFASPPELGPIDGQTETWTPLPVTLDDIISEELQINPEVATTDFDVTDLSAIEVIGYTAAGSQARTCQELCEVHYVDVVPGNPIRFQRRGTTSVSTIPFVDTGVGVDDSLGPFTGLKRGNADERPAIAALRFPLIDRDHEAGYERGDRLSTDSDDVRTIETRVVMGAEKAKGRAITATLLDKVRSHTAQFALSDKYAKLEPADVYTPQDNDGNSYRLRAVRFSYADGVKSVEWELDDTTALVETGLTDTNYTPSVEIVPPGVAGVIPLDIPLQRVQDDNAGYLAAVKCSDESRVYYLESPSDTTYTEVAQFPIDAVFGGVSSITGAPSIVATDTGCSVTVDVGDGTLASITDATLLLDNTANRFVIGAYGREVIGQFRDCTLSAPGVYVLSGFLWGLCGTGQYVNDLTAGDHFCVLNESGGVKHIDRTSAQLGVAHYIKAVPERRSQASITGETFTNSGVALKPLVGINPHAERDAGSGDITLTWDRQTRYPTRFGGDLGDSCPLGEESEQYRVRLYTDNTFATLVRTFDVVTTSEVTYTSAQRTTDSHTPITAALYVDVRQISAVVGEGYALQATL